MVADLSRFFTQIAQSEESVQQQNDLMTQQARLMGYQSVNYDAQINQSGSELADLCKSQLEEAFSLDSDFDAAKKRHQHNIKANQDALNGLQSMSDAARKEWEL